MNSTSIVVPDPAPEPIVLGARSGGDSWPDNSIRVGGLDGYTIRTIGRIGQRIDDDGGIQGLVDDLRSTAALAICELLLSTDEGAGTLEDQRSQVGIIHDQAVALGDQVFDKSAWSVHTMNVDGTAFALWVATRSEGFAAVADLGAVRVTMHGSSLPEPLDFALVPAPGVRRTASNTKTNHFWPGEAPRAGAIRFSPARTDFSSPIVPRLTFN